MIQKIKDKLKQFHKLMKSGRLSKIINKSLQKNI